MSEATETKAEGKEEKKKPKFSLKVPVGQGHNIELAVFEFSGKKADDEGEFRTESIVVHRSFHDGTRWRRTQGFRPSDLPALALAIKHVWHHLIKERNA